MVAAGFCDKLQIQLSYAIGVAEPTSICVDTFGTSKYSDDEIIEIIRNNFDLTPKGIIEKLDLRRPIYKKQPLMAILEEMTWIFHGKNLIRLRN